MGRKKVFWLYFWKSYWYRTKKYRWIVFYDGIRHIVENVNIKVPIITHQRKRNPHCVIKGKASKFTRRNNTLYVE